MGRANPWILSFCLVAMIAPAPLVAQLTSPTTPGNRDQLSSEGRRILAEFYSRPSTELRDASRRLEGLQREISSIVHSTAPYERVEALLEALEEEHINLQRLARAQMRGLLRSLPVEDRRIYLRSLYPQSTPPEMSGYRPASGSPSR